MPKVWRFLPFDSGYVRGLSAELNISPVLAQVLVARGYRTAGDSSAFLNPKLTELHDPELLPGVPEAADRIVAAVQAGRRITIYGDYDVDGVTATSLLWHCLKLASANVDYYVPHRLEEGYGLNCDALRKFHAEDPARLVVTVDCGIASVAEAELARELGLELIITDHHNFTHTLPPAACLVHPRLPGGAYPFGDLCGVGVAFKLAWGVCQRLGDGKKASPRMRDFLISSIGLAAIGTVADVVPLVGENRIIVRFGLNSLRERSSLGLKALLRIAGLEQKQSLLAEDIAFSIAPRINAAGRLGQARLAVELLTTESADRATVLAEYIDQQNKVRQTVERKVFKQAKELVEANPAWEEQGALVLAHPEWHAGVIGIVANRVAEHYQKPAVLISLNREDGIGQGSARSFANFDLFAGLSACAEHLATFGGHQYAAGLRVQSDRIDIFRIEFGRYVTANHDVHSRDLELHIDAEVRLADLTHRAVTELDRLGPFGRSNPRPVFACARVELAEPPRKIGGGERHLSLKVRQHGRTMRGVSFGHADWADEMVADQPISISFAPSINSYCGQENVEIQVIDWKPEPAGRPPELAGAVAAQPEAVP